MEWQSDWERFPPYKEGLRGIRKLINASPRFYQERLFAPRVVSSSPGDCSLL
ncbi:hypothetical protein BDQ94DRAFT_133847 [Aspergillus welwitschiae]|uniref:Uncharacterized protein n=1 Tax=Aspergillus welwitschiae TaxID=1341132 RepID=A0A3F3QIC3_9EURO|nr:hypothetical protein BDQ94DRAFT_133847 [Aspergillus welwitschiae]RDH38416.1 hypothetical protein BDQ94DRAFT_133847 [Aspergillus welwitschiae]